MAAYKLTYPMYNSLNSIKQRPVKPTKKAVIPGGRLYMQAFDHSLQANIIFTVSDGKIISANKAACKLLGYPKNQLLTRNRKDIFSLSESNYKKWIRHRKATGWAKADLSIIKKNGALLPCEITSVIFKDEFGTRNSIVSITDLRERLLKQKKIDAENNKLVAGNIIIAQSKSDTRQAENNNWIKSIAAISYDLIWDWDITTNVISFGSNYEKVFGYKLPGTEIHFKEWIHFFPPEEGAIIEKKIKSAFESSMKNWEDTYLFTCPDGSEAQVISRANIVRDQAGNAIRMIGVILDISKMHELEEILEHEIRMKERQIMEAIVEAKETERSDIGKELHDNINQLLGASMLYLDMARKDINNGEIYLIHSSEYTLTAIEEIRKLTKGLTTDAFQQFGLCGAVRQISRDTMETYPVKIHCKMDDSLEETMSEKFKLNTFRIFQEQLNNILKHAKASHIVIAISQTKAGFILSIADDGTGFDTTKKMKGIGINNIISRSALYKGNARFTSAPGKGCKLVVTFPAIM
jgi:PAS domain S-box-containing protein